MKRDNHRFGLVLAAMLALAMTTGTASVRAARQADDPQAAGRAVPDLVPLDVEIVVSRYRDDERVSRAPYVLAVTAASERPRAEAAQLNIGAEVPVPATTFTPARNDGPEARPMVSFNYRHVGTTIECWAVVRADGRYALNVSIDESSVYTGDSQGAPSTVAGSPVFRSYESRNTLLLRNGQSRQYIAATDRVSGEVIRIEVTLRVAD
jgi:hypothetical protein